MELTERKKKVLRSIVDLYIRTAEPVGSKAIAELPEREKCVISLRYFHGLTQDRVAKVLGVSQVQVSRIESKIIKRFREKLSG